MVPWSAILLGSLLLLTSHSECSSAPSSDDQQVLQLVNQYRTEVVGIPALSTNNAAACMAQEVAQRFVGTPCNNETGADAKPGATQFSDLPNMLAACHVQLVNTTKSVIALDCVPVSAESSNAPAIAAQNFTKFQEYQKKINDTMYTSAGVGSDGIWYVLILATDSSDGNYGVTPGLNGATPQQRVQMGVILSFLFLILATLHGPSIW